MPPRILIVDDDAMLRTALRRTIRAQIPGCEVVETDCEPAAVQALDASPFDVVISDVVMGDADAGWRLARAARARGVPVLLASGAIAAAESGNSDDDVPLVSKHELTSGNVAELLACVMATQGRG